MTDNRRKMIPQAVIKKARPAWLLWLVPLAAAALCVWFVYRDYVASGPLITIYFKNVEGLMEGNTQLQYLGSQIGQVKEITLSPDLKSVKVIARMSGDARNLAREGSLFWIVRPEVKMGMISGLRTIVTGEYIDVQPGVGPVTNVFAGAEKKPLKEQPGTLYINVRSVSLNSLRELSPVYYRGIQVGEVTGYQLDSDSRAVMLRVSVRPEYTPLVRMNSKFWNAGGLDVHFGLFKGAEVSAESAQALFGGGIAFATPPALGEPAVSGAVFELNEKAKEEWKNWTPGIPLNLPQQAPATPPTPVLNPSFK